jgi:tRNA A64-2'-O-ribosylphosphate transferase
MSDKLSQEQLKAVTLRELKVEPYKYDRHSLQNILPEVVQFARENMKSNKRMLVVCDDGQDISPALVSTVVLYCFPKIKGKINHRTTCADICDFPECSDVKYTKDDIRNAVSCVNQFCPTAHPSRGSIKQVFNYFHRLERINPPSED